MNYEAMNAFELVCAIETLGQREGTSRDMPWPDSLPALMSILRRRVIQEASVGKAEIAVINGYPYTSICINNLKSGDYDLILRKVS